MQLRSDGNRVSDVAPAAVVLRGNFGALYLLNSISCPSQTAYWQPGDGRRDGDGPDICGSSFNRTRSQTVFCYEQINLFDFPNRVSLPTNK